MTSSLPHGTFHGRSTARLWTCAPAPAQARAFHAGLRDYVPTALTELPALADELGVGRVFVKDESSRLGLPAFKALGASWAIHQVMSGYEGVRPVRLITATDGNHGHAVARLARLLGLRSHVFVPEAVPQTVIATIRAEGAEITEVAGNYDQAVGEAAAAARAPSSVLVQDTAWPGYERIPGWIVDGYSTLFAEIDEQLAAAGADGPDLVSIPVGVGSLAQAAVTHYRSRNVPPARRGTASSRPENARRENARRENGRLRVPALLAVEPTSAACVLASLDAGRPVSVPTGGTIMAGLNCGTPSSLAWPYLEAGLDAAVAVDDDASVAAAEDLATLGVAAGPCGAASLAGVRVALAGGKGTERRTLLSARRDSTLVLLSTEGTSSRP